MERYRAFLADQSGYLRSYLFEDNIRAFQGTTEVNNEIRSTLKDEGSPPFWWLNNGITIVAASVERHQKRLVLEDAQIVNGLQTSRLIFDADEADVPAENRHVLVRVINVADSSVRDKVIRATNSQTKIPASALLANDAIQYQLELLLGQAGYSYERRKGQYRGEGVRRDRIVSITDLAQAIVSIRLGEPDQARARPSSLLKTGDTARRVFSDKVDRDDFVTALNIQRRVDEYLRRPEAQLAAWERGNVRFHLATTVCALKTGKWPEASRGLGGVARWIPDDDELAEAMALHDDTRERYIRATERQGNDAVAKSIAFREALKTAVKERVAAQSGSPRKRFRPAKSTEKIRQLVAVEVDDYIDDRRSGHGQERALKERSRQHAGSESVGEGHD